MKHTLKLHSITTEFHRSLHAVTIWKKYAISKSKQSEKRAESEMFWRIARLSRVFALMRSRKGQLGDDQCIHDNHRVLWKSGLGTVGQLSPCILYFSLISRSHNAVSNNHFESRRLLMGLRCLRDQAETNMYTRSQSQRSLYFWKYWREATCLKRYVSLCLLTCLLAYLLTFAVDY